MGLPTPAFATLLSITLSCAITAAWADPNPPSLHTDTGAWTLTRQWTPAETRHYASWVERIYDKKTEGTVEQRGAKLERVLTDPDMNLLLDPHFLGDGSNPQLSLPLIRSMNGVMDCGKFTAFMPAYYAYRRGLPWMTAKVVSGGGDIRTAPSNTPVGSVNCFTSESVESFFREAVGTFISGNYRINLDGRGAGLSDTVPVALNRKHLMPGVINYLDGHCLLLANISDYGELRFLNCSTTPTRDIFSYNGMNTVSGVPPRGDSYEGCFQGMRVLRYPIAVTDAAGRVVEVRRRTNEEMKEFGFSTEQYDVMREMHDTQHIIEKGTRVGSYFDFLRLRMMSVESVSPLQFLEDYAREILAAYETREAFVQDAWENVQRGGWITYPEDRANENIFQALGRWETWSSPSSDVDRRNKYFYLGDWLDFAIRMYRIDPGFIDLTGLERYGVASHSDLAKALLAEKGRIFAAKSITYTNSNGTPVRLTLQDIEHRLYDLSFDPNHPPELRWGAPADSAERATAPQTWTPVPDGSRVAMEEAYELQAYYRCVGQRETHGSSLRDMFTQGFPVRDKVDAQVGRWIENDTQLAANGSGEGMAAENAAQASRPRPEPPQLRSLSQRPRPAAQSIHDAGHTRSTWRR